MTLLSPDQIQILRQLTTDAAVQASANLGLDVVSVRSFIDKFTSFVAENNNALGQHSYLAILAESKPHAEPLTPRLALKKVLAGHNILYVDSDFHLVGTLEGGIRMIDCAERTATEHVLGIKAEGAYIYVFLLGKQIDECHVLYPGSNPPIAAKWHRPIVEFDLLIQDHKKTWVDREQEIRYWQNRANRILLAGPDGTERIFHQSLFVWLNMFVLDALKVFAEARGLGQDKTDITVVTLSGNHVVEVKWLGKNENNTAYGEERINEGLIQVKGYLVNDESLVCGHLIVYDGRQLDAHTNESRHSDTHRHALCQVPTILFLGSETPSEAAVRIAAESPL